MGSKFLCLITTAENGYVMSKQHQGTWAVRRDYNAVTLCTMDFSESLLWWPATAAGSSPRQTGNFW